MNFLTRLKAAFSNSAYMTSSVKVISGGDAVRQPFSYQSAVRAYRSWIYAAANLNAVAVASQPLRLYVRSTGVGTKLWRTRKVSIRQKAYLAGQLAQVPSRSTMTKAAEYGDDFEVVTEMHPILELLAKVNPYQNGFDATVLRVLYTELTGNAYLHPVMDRALGRPVELWTMPSQNVEIVPGKETLVEGYLYGQSREQRRFFATDEVIHFKRPNPADLYYGLGKAEAAWGAAMANEAIHEMDLSFFANKARPDYLMTFKGAADPSEIERLEVQIDEKLRGTKRTGRFLTMSSDIDLKPMGFPPKDLAGRGEIVEEIAAVFGVPVSMLKANDPNLASATVGFAAWKQNTILPLLRMDEEVLNQNLIPLFGIEGDAFLAYDNPVLEDERFEFERIRTSVAAGLLTVNEARKAQGLEAVSNPAADELLFNNQPLGGPVPPALPPLPEPPTGPTSSPTEPVGGEETTEPVLAADLPAEPPADGQTAGKAVPSTKGATAGYGRQDAMLTLGEVDGLTDFRKAAGSECVSDKIRTLLDEGYEQNQAVAIAISMCDAGAKAVGDIETKPPAVVAENAERALAVREEKPESERGMTAVGIARARDLANRASLSEETIRRMVAYFERHQSDKQGESWDEQGKGWQAWNGWGGDEGWSWAKRKRDEFDRARADTKAFDEAMTKAIDFALSVADCYDADIDCKNCGVGPDGFEQGNECGGGGGGGGSAEASKPATDKPKAPKKPRAPKKPAAEAGKPPAAGLKEPKKHDVALPANPRRMTVDQFDAGLSALGYSAVSSRKENPYSRTEARTYYTVRDASGKTAEVELNDLLGTMYANSNDPKLAKVKPARRKSVDSEEEDGCDCGCGKCGGTISQKSVWTLDALEPPAILTKAKKPNAAREFDAITDDERRIGAAVDKVLQKQIAAVLKELNASTVPTAELTLKVESLLKSARWDREIVEAMRPYLQASLQNGLNLGIDTMKSLAKTLPDFAPQMANLEAYTRSESVRLARGAAQGVNRYTSVRVSKILGDGIEQGRSIPQIADDVQAWAGEKGDAERSTRSRALTIARTEAQRATRKAESEAWKSTGLVEGKTWLLAPDPCEFCEAAAAAFGQKSVGINDSFYKQGETLVGADGGTMSLDYEAIDGPPLHPNCRCSMQPQLIDDYEQIIKDAEAEAAKMTGPFEEGDA